MTVKKPPKKVQSLRISQDLLHRIATLERKRANELKTQAAVVRTAIGLGVRQAEWFYYSPPVIRARPAIGLSIAAAKPFLDLLLPDLTYPEDDLEPYRLSIRLASEMLERIEKLAKKRGAAIHHTSKKVIISPTILYAISIGLDLLEQLPSISVSDLKKLEPVQMHQFVRSY